MTWYGITDLRASLGLEFSKGPILSALLAEEYTDIFILGYTNKDKVETNNLDFEKDLLASREAFETNNQKEVWTFINQYSNVEIAHGHFIKWLKSELKKANLKTEVIFHPVQLSKLNDTEGIYDIAVEALDVVANFNTEKEVTFYLSPGTPVMAFVWAFVALRHPTLKKRLIASPIASKPPEVVSLPNEWLEWHSKQVDDKGKHISKYDMIFHLFGEQRMPSLLGVLQFESKKHVFVNTRKYPAEVMKQFIGESEFDEMTVDPYDPAQVRERILKYLEDTSSNAKIGFNLTGGTKLMYAGALEACKKINAVPFYFDGRHHKVIFLDYFNSEKTKLINSVDTFIKLHDSDLHISKPGYWNDIPGIDSPSRKELTDLLWKQRKKIASLYYSMVPFNDGNSSFEFNKSGIKVKYSKNGQAEINIDNKFYTFDNWIDFPKYITGGWFEEYMYMQLKPFVDSGQIHDLRIGLEISFKDKKKNNNTSGMGNLKNIFGDTYQELDLVFTDGRRLYIVECKAGNVKSEHIMKLQNIVRYFGGSAGKGILAACFPPASKVARKKVNDSGNINLVSGKSLQGNLALVI